MALKKKSKNKNKIPVESKTTIIQVKGKEKSRIGINQTAQLMKD